MDRYEGLKRIKSNEEYEAAKKRLEEYLVQYKWIAETESPLDDIFDSLMECSKVRKIYENEENKENEEDYSFLEYLYAKYTNGISIENPQQEDLYRDLCLARLEKRKIEEGKCDTDISKTQARILNLMRTLKLDDFESTKPKTLSEQLMFAKIAQIEMLKPCDLYKEPQKYKDFNKVRKYYQDICLRPLKNTLAGTRDFDIDVDNLQDYQLELKEEE